MTTKDQAIAYSQFLTDVVTAAGLLEHGKQCKELAARIAKYAFDSRSQPPAPDCRTCERRYPEVDGAYGGYTNKCDMKCTNGDQYQPAPKLVLWRTV